MTDPENVEYWYIAPEASCPACHRRTPHVVCNLIEDDDGDLVPEWYQCRDCGHQWPAVPPATP